MLFLGSVQSWRVVKSRPLRRFGMPSEASIFLIFWRIGVDTYHFFTLAGRLNFVHLVVAGILGMGA